MDWHEAKARIAASIRVGAATGRPGTSARQVLAVDHRCQRHDYDGERGFLVRIGVESNETIHVPWSMLETCYGELVSSGYDGTAFRRHFLRQAAVHPCHIHVVGMMFVLAGLATSDGNTQARYTLALKR